MKTSRPNFGLVVIAVVIVLFAFMSCREEKKENPKVVRQEAVTPADSPAEAKVLAMIGEDKITEDDLDAVMSNIPERVRPRLRQKSLESLVEARVFGDEARKAGFSKDPEVKALVDRMQADVLSRSYVKQYIDKKADPSEEELRSFYDNHKDQFLVPDGVQVREIRAKDRKQLVDAQKLLEKGEDFAKVAREYSRAPSRFQGGLAGWIYKGKAAPALGKVVFALGKDQVSDIIKTDDGHYTIMKVVDKKEQHYMPYEDAKSGIRLRFFNERRKKLLDGYYEAAGIDRNPSEEGAFVKIGETVIPNSYLKARLGRVPEGKLKERWMQYLIDRTIFEKEARKIHLENDPEISRELRQGEDRILANVFRKRVIGGKAKISDQEIAEYYKSHKESLTPPEKVRLKDILVKTKREAEEALEELKTAVSFAEVAMKRSIRPNAAAKGGTIGWFQKGELDPALEKVAFSLDTGGVSGVVKTADGYEIIKVMEKRGGQVPSLEKVKADIKMKLMVDRLEKAKKEYYNKHGVKILTDA